MSLFSRKPSHQAQLLALARIAAILYERTVEQGADAPAALHLNRKDSRFRYMIFCISTVQAVCAPRMSNPDAVLNECAHNAIVGWATNPQFSQQLFGGPIEVYQAGNEGIGHLQDFLHRWSAYIDIAKGGNRLAATMVVCRMLHEIGSVEPDQQADGERLWPLALWIEGQFGAIDSAFVELCG